MALVLGIIVTATMGSCLVALLVALKCCPLSKMRVSGEKKKVVKTLPQDKDKTEPTFVAPSIVNEIPCVSSGCSTLEEVREYALEDQNSSSSSQTSSSSSSSNIFKDLVSDYWEESMGDASDDSKSEYGGNENTFEMLDDDDTWEM